MLSCSFSSVFFQLIFTLLDQRPSLLAFLYYNLYILTKQLFPDICFLLLSLSNNISFSCIFFICFTFVYSIPLFAQSSASSSAMNHVLHMRITRKIYYLVRITRKITFLGFSYVLCMVFMRLLTSYFSLVLVLVMLALSFMSSLDLLYLL